MQLDRVSFICTDSPSFVCHRYRSSEVFSIRNYSSDIACVLILSVLRTCFIDGNDPSGQVCFYIVLVQGSTRQLYLIITKTGRQKCLTSVPNSPTGGILEAHEVVI